MLPDLSPDLPRSQYAEADVPLRYHDVVQDGRLRVTAVPPAFGHTVWSQLLEPHPIQTDWPKRGIVPILTRVLVRAGGGPLDVRRPVHARAGWELAHAEDDTGAVARVLLTMRLDLDGRRGHMHFPPEDAGKPIRLGGAWTESTFTRPFAPPGQRRVTSLEEVGVSARPGPRRPLLRATEVLEVPDDVERLDTWSAEPQPLVFGLDDTDSNQHVNSLAYPRRFAEAALARLARLGLPTTRMVTGYDVRFRKPSFAGDVTRVYLRTWRRDDLIGVHAALVADGDGPDAALTQPLCAIRLELSA